MMHSKALPNKSRSTLTFAALGTQWSIEFDAYHDQQAKLEALLLETTANFEQAYSRFRTDSLVTILNDQQKLDDPPEELVDMLSYALNIFQRTDGLFNVSVGGVLESRGYGLSTGGSIATNLLETIHITQDQISLSESIRLDFGGFGKGWLIDKLGDLLQANDCTSYIINGGGDIAIHDNTKQAIAIEHPYDTSQYVGFVDMATGALASSSNNKRTWTHKGQKHAHIINPSTNPITAELASLHVYAHNATVADTLATALYVAHPSQRKHLAAQCGVAYMEIGTDLASFRTADFPFRGE